MRKTLLCAVISLLLVFNINPALSYGGVDDSLEEALRFLRAEFSVLTASKFVERLDETPSTMLVLTADDIENRGYTCLNDIMLDLPGFDIAAAHGDMTMLAY